MRRALPTLAFLALAASPAVAQRDSGSSPPIDFQPTPSNWTFGGSFGLGFGSVNWISVSPQVGYLISSKLWTGITGRLQFSNDTRYDPDFNAFNYGFGLFLRYFAFDRVFAQAEWSWQSYANRGIQGATFQQTTSSVYLGGGYTQPLTNSTAVVMELGYDVTGNATAVVGTPWAFRVGVTTGF